MASRTPSLLKPTLLACAIQAALPFLIGSAYAQATETTTTQLEAITVTSSADASAEGLSKPYAGGQVARGGRAGILGTQDNMDTPFSITSYTNEFIKNQQARGVADVLQNDPTVRVARGFGNFQESYFIRGFIVNSDDIAYNGLYGILPRQYTSAELFERVEVLRGASAFLNGAAPSGGGIGGTINLLPKRAPNTPLSEVSFGIASGSQYLISTDIARRFGPNENTGIRINAAHREGGTGIQNEDTKLDLFSVGMDWRSRNVRVSADIGYQNHKLTSPRPNVTITGLTGVPTPPDNTVNYGQNWTHSNERDVFGTVRAEYDISDTTTAWAAAGLRNGREDNLLAGPTVSNLDGTSSISRFDNQRKDDIKSAEIGIRSKIETGAVKHSLVASLSYFQSKEKNAYYINASSQSLNIYNPTPVTMPALDPIGVGYTGSNLSDPDLVRQNNMTSVAIGDTMSFLEDKLLITLGLRHQRMNYQELPFLQTSPFGTGPSAYSQYKKSKTSPVLGAVLKIRDDLSLYANYIEGLSRGDRATNPNTLANFGASLPPYVSKQKEIGLKYDGGRFGGDLAFFSTSKPSSLVVNNFFTSSGEDKHQGIELTVFGEATKNLKILGGLTWLDAKRERTGDATTEGKRVIGIPEKQASVGTEYSGFGIQGLSVNARAVYTGDRYADAANTQRVQGFTRIDLGTRYLTEVGGKLVTLRARVDNVTDKNYWASVGGYPSNGYLVLGAPRTFSLTASLDF